ncbi:MAG: glutamyl-tRNA reductase [Candidatus Nanopelagicales bacterium]
MFVVSANFKVSQWELLNRLSERVGEMEQRLHADGSLPVVTVATCNRVEMYGDSAAGAASLARVIEIFSEVLDVPESELFQQLFVATGVDAIEHLHRMTSGLEAIAVGESEVGGQVRRAYTSSIQAGRISPRLRRAFDDALRVNRDLRRLEPHKDTNLVALALDLIPDTSSLHQLLVIGTGEFARTVHQRMHQFGVHEQWNFSTSGRRVSLPFPSHRVEAADLPAALGQVDIVIAATGAEKPVITRAMIDQLEAGGGRVPVLIDLAVTQDIDVAIDAKHPVIRLEQLARNMAASPSETHAKYVRMRAELLAHRMEVSEAGHAS